MTGTRRSHLLAILLLTWVVAGCYWNSLSNGFVADDAIHIVTNTMIKDPRLLPHLVTKAYFSDSLMPMYRPVYTLSLFMDYRFSGLNPFGFHVTNLLLHLGTAVLVYAFFVLLFAQPRAALVGAALFAAHPAHTEAVSWISGRGIILAVGPVLAALCCFLRRERSSSQTARAWLLAAGLAAYGVALLAKESSAVLILLLTLVDWARHRPGPGPGPGPGDVRSRRSLYAGVALVTAGYLILRFGIMAFPQAQTWPPLGERLRVWPYATWLHLRLLLSPLDLAYERTFQSPMGVMDPMVLFPAAVITALLLGLLWLWYREERLACVGLLWIFVALGPVSNVIPFLPAVGLQPVAPRHLYLPAVGFTLLLSLAFTRLRSRAMSLGLAGLLVLTYGTITIQRNPVWHDNFSLWQDTAEQVPQNPEAHNNLGVEYERRGDAKRAVREFAWATYLFPGYAIAYHNIGLVYFKQGRLDLAARYLRQALRLNPLHPQALAHLGIVYQRQGRFERAIRLYRPSLKEDPRQAEVWANMGAAYAATGRQALALKAFEEAQRLTRDRP